MDLKDLTAAERRVWEAFARGVAVVFGQADDDPADGGGWGRDRTVRAEVMRALLLGEVSDLGEVSALRITGARISGRLDLQYAEVRHPIRLMSCYFDEVPDLYGARARQVNLSDSVLPEVRAATVRIEGVLRLTGCRIDGEVQLGGARITGAVFCDRARLGGLMLNHARIEDDVWAPGIVVSGQLRLDGATVTGTVNLDDSELINEGGDALRAETLAVGGDLRGNRLLAQGRVNVRGAKIAGQLNLASARLRNLGGVALRASNCTIGELWLGNASPIQGTVNLRNSRVDFLSIRPQTWGPAVRLDGFSYTTLDPPLPAIERLAVLERDEKGYVPYAYEQLAAAYRRVGDDAAARTVQLAKQRRQRRTLTWYAKIWGYLQDAAVGYGYRPMRAAAWLTLLLAVGTVAYGLHHPPPVERGKGPDFNAFIYTLNLLLPIVDFGQAHAFNPHGAYQWLSYVLIAAGWILATTIVAGVTRAVNRQ